MTEDSELVRRFKDGDEAGFDELVRRYQPRIFSLMYRMVRNTEDARELTQDTFVRAYQALPRFEGRSGFYTWLYRIGVNQAFNYLRSKKRQTIQATELHVDEDALANLPAGTNPQSDFHQLEIREAVARAVAALPERQRAVFVMRQYDGLRNNEIAQILKCSEGAIKAHYFFAVQKLQTALKEWQP